MLTLLVAPWLPSGVLSAYPPWTSSSPAPAPSSSGCSELKAWEAAASLVCRIATVGLSLTSAIMTAASTRCVYRNDGSPAGSVSYSDYGSFKYSAVANLVSAVLQGVAIWLEVVGKERRAKTIDLIDKLVLALTSTSAPQLFAVDNITSSCGGRRRSRSIVCDQAGSLCRQLRLASLPSLARRAAVMDSSAVAQTTTRRARAPPAGPGAVVERVPRQAGGADDGGHGGGVGDSGADENPRDNRNSGGGGDDGDEHEGGGGGGQDECQVIDAHQGSRNTAREEEIEEEDRGDGTRVEEEDDRSVTQRGGIVSVIPVPAVRRWPFG
ncbi:hypothetical protein SETIT_3G345200v2 [Setaria italica]|uniref:CASP-like protein n=1 Tax=Setaria italica TaxID=4555 RepID=A0A368QNX1_SETIT|nr:hypothetical protein SETIT_3G345200v2 [Setaria italica]